MFFLHSVTIFFFLGKYKRVRSWTTPERAAYRIYFAPFYETRTYPSQKELEKVIYDVPELKNTTPNKLK